jgi:6-phosphogluconolactonase
MNAPTSRLLVGTYTEKLPHVDGKAAGILGAPYDGDTIDGSAVLAEVRNPSWLAVSADGRFVYAVVETVEFEGQPGGGVAAFARDQDTGALTELNTRPSAGVEPAHVAVDPSGAYVLVANYRSGSVAVFAIEPDGSLGEMVDHRQHEGSSAHPKRQTGPHAHQVLFDPVTGHAIVPDLGMDSVLFYDFGADGKLTELLSSRFVAVPGAGPRHLAFHPDNEHLFLLNELDNTLVVLRRKGDTFVQEHVASTLPVGFDQHSQGSEIRVAASGRYVYTSNRGDLDSIAIFEFEAESSTVTLRHIEPSLGAEPRDFVFSPDGTHLVVANQDSDNIVTFLIDESGPTLTHVSTTEIPTPVCLVFV